MIDKHVDGFLYRFTGFGWLMNAEKEDESGIRMNDKCLEEG